MDPNDSYRVSLHPNHYPPAMIFVLMLEACGPPAMVCHAFAAARFVPSLSLSLLPTPTTIKLLDSPPPSATHWLTHMSRLQQIMVMCQLFHEDAEVSRHTKVTI